MRCPSTTCWADHVTTSPDIQVKRVYVDAESGDGTRVLVDRLWPRGVRKESLAHDVWLKEVAPTSALRTWYGHDPARFEEFAERYRQELAEGEQQEALTQLRSWATHGRLTLLTATKRDDISAATVLARLLER